MSQYFKRVEKKCPLLKHIFPFCAPILLSAYTQMLVCESNIHFCTYVNRVDVHVIEGIPPMSWLKGLFSKGWKSHCLSSQCYQEPQAGKDGHRKLINPAAYAQWPSKLCALLVNIKKLCKRLGKCKFPRERGKNKYTILLADDYGIQRLKHKHTVDLEIFMLNIFVEKSFIV